MENIEKVISRDKPETWKQLQDLVARTMTECGWQADTEVVVQTVRGKAEIDVMAKEEVDGREFTALVECKNWKTKVPQAVVHGFRTVVADIGANFGYIVSKAGFQAGAFEAVKNTNIKLLSWEEFQNEFEEQWYWRYVPQFARERLDGICSYLEPLPAMTAWDEHLTEQEVDRLKELYQTHMPLGVLILSLQHFSSALMGAKRRLQLPLADQHDIYASLPDEIRSEVSYRELLEKLDAHVTPILAEFRSYRDLALKRRAIHSE